ncbi:MAG: META domain-containing protein [Minisyncoccota bacterium]
MNLRNFFVGRAVGFLVLLSVVGVVAGFYTLNNYIYREKQADEDVNSIHEKTWVWVSALYNDGREVLPKKGSNFTLTFGTDGKFIAGTDCNSVGGSYVVDEEMGGVSFSNIFSTKMYCEGSQEMEFIKLLEGTQGYHITREGELILNLKFDSGSVVFR